MSNQARELPTRQEMFNRAWNGLKSQGWRQAYDRHGATYITTDGRRCAWGWVDPDGTSGAGGSLLSLRLMGIGLAALLSREDFEFASDLQRTHDIAANNLESDMRNFARRHGLSIPGV